MRKPTPPSSLPCYTSTMKKSTLILASLVGVLGIAFGALLIIPKKEKAPLPESCPTDTMMCPDGTSIPRSGPNCEFGICKQEVSVYAPQTPTGTGTPQITPVTQTSTQKPSLLKKVTTTIASLFVEQPQEPAPKTEQQGSGSTDSKPAENKPALTQATPAPGINENRLNVVNNKIVDTNNVTLYTIPQALTSTPPSGWTSHTVNVIAVSNVPPVIGAIPVNGVEGKYYVSENSFGNLEACEFSNKIYILDTVANTKTLMYEENNTTLTDEDPRSCHSEMYLLATDNEKLILKYHTIGTNMTCDSTWSEPEKTWYMNVTKTTEGTKRYYITPSLYTKAEELEEACRSTVSGSSTPSQVTTGEQG